MLSNKQPSDAPKLLEKQEHGKPKISKMERNNKDNYRN
jgi:hypothetical protein